MQMILIGVILAQGPIDFWGTKKKAAVERPTFKDEAAAAEWYVKAPTEQNAAAYLAWQRERLKKIRSAQEKLLEAFVKEQAAGIEATLVYYSAPDCPYCKVQERILERVKKWLPGVKVREGKEPMQAVPVIVVQVGERRVRLDGVATELRIAQAIKEAANE